MCCSVPAGKYMSCVVLADGTAWCWGKGDTGTLGDGKGKASCTPVQVLPPQ